MRRPADVAIGFPFLFGGTFIEGVLSRDAHWDRLVISLPFRRDFH